MSLWQSYRGWKARRQLRRDAQALLKEAQRIRRRYPHRLTAGQAKDLDARSTALRNALVEDRDVQSKLEQLNALLDGALAFAKKSQARQYVESIGAVVFVALVLRSLVVEAYQIPSGSMIPTLDVGDRIWVNKLIYGVRLPFTDIKLGTHYRPPRRGEIIVFEKPDEPDKDLIKRVVGVAGDTVELREGMVYVNGVAVARQHDGGLHYWDKEEQQDLWKERNGDAWREKMGVASFVTLHDPDVERMMRDPEYESALRDSEERKKWTFPPTQVPPDKLFVMGDNRDNSNDSRFWGFVPLNLVRGRAMVVWWSNGEPEGVRFKRFGHLIE
jgi:signal peptidase I